MHVEDTSRVRFVLERPALPSVPEEVGALVSEAMPEAKNSALDALQELAAGGDILEEFRPLCRSLEWRLGQGYWHGAGSRAFLGDHVPFKITNDGNLARKAADVFFASAAAADQEGALEPRVRVLEFGPGLGLFARRFLDVLRERCSRKGCDYYERLEYILADRSPRMLDDLRASGVLEDHAARCVFRVADAAEPASALVAPDAEPGADGRRDPNRPGVRAVLLNYVLDCLPAAIVRFHGDEVEQLLVRTRLARRVNPRRHTRFSLQEIRALAASDDPAPSAGTAELQRLFALELEYRPTRPEDEPPYLASARRCASTGTSGVVLHNFGAIGCLERALGLLVPGGLVLIDDYVDSPFDPATQSFRHQHFGGSVALGLNLALLEKHFSDREDCRWVAPPDDNRHLASRLLTREPAPQTAAVFRKRFSASAFAWHFSPVEQARAHVKAKRRESALAAFTEALRRQPDNWALMAEIADFLAYTTCDYAAGLRVTEQALAVNPWWADLWNIRGDCFYYLKRFDEAHAAFERALGCRPADTRARYNLSYTLAQRGDFPAALVRIAEALADDPAGKYRDRLLEKQREILEAIDERTREVDRCVADRFRAILGAARPANLLST